MWRDAGEEGRHEENAEPCEAAKLSENAPNIRYSWWNPQPGWDLRFGHRDNGSAT